MSGRRVIILSQGVVSCPQQYIYCNLIIFYPPTPDIASIVLYCTVPLTILFCAVLHPLLYCTVSGVNGTYMSVVAGSSASLPCITTSTSPREQPTLILWFKEEDGKPIFRWRHLCILCVSRFCVNRNRFCGLRSKVWRFTSKNKSLHYQIRLKKGDGLDRK